MHRPPDFVDALRSDLSDWQRWVGRVVVLLFAAFAGLSVVAFTWLCDRASGAFHDLTAWQPLLPLLWTPAWTAGLVWLTRRFAAAAAGSGIPQVMAALSLPDGGPGTVFVSLRLAFAKIVLTAGGLLAGLAIGREGPSVQIAAGVMQHARRWLPNRSAVDPRSLLVAGGAAGIAAAFNAPLAGVMFAIEELTRRIERVHSGLVISAIVLSGLIAISVFGNATYFGVIRVEHLGIDDLLPGVLVVLACGLLGGLFSRLLLASLLGDGGRISRWRRERPVRFAAVCGLAIAVIGQVSGGASFGSGYDTTRQLVEGHGEMPLLYMPLRFIATWLAVWSGVPGGLFAPSLSIGAGIGNDVALLTGTYPHAAPLIAIGMAAFLAAVTQAPITAFIIVMEMVDGHAMVLSLMAAAMIASLVSRWLSTPLYATLAHAQVEALGPADPPLPARS